jgi:hypothetical protein
MQIARRRILTLAAGLGVQPFNQKGRCAANDRIRVAIVGVNGRGNALMKSLHRIQQDGVEVAALCDVDGAVLAKRTAEYEKLSGKRVPTCTDMRRLMGDAPGAIWTMQADKDAYALVGLALWARRRATSLGRPCSGSSM